MLLLLLVVLPIVSAQFLGPAKIDVERIEKCGEDQLGFKADIVMKKANRTHYVVNVDFESSFDIGDEVQVNFTAAKWGDGGYKPHYYDIFDKNPCVFMEKYGGDIFDHARKNLGQPDKCPLLAGTYKLKDFFVGSDFELPLPYGKFRVNWIWTKDGIEFMCLEYYITVTQRREKVGSL